MTKKKAKEKKDWRVSVLEWVHAIAFAVFLSMVVRYYLIETFKIPTGSMQPTLWGNKNKGDLYMLNRNLHDLYPGRGSKGDQILVNKAIYHFKDPERWDVIVFKFPNDVHTTYIKRLWGLPGESIQVVDGDVWIDGKIERKPPKTQKLLWMLEFDESLLRKQLKKEIRAETGRGFSLSSEAMATSSKHDATLRAKILNHWEEQNARSSFIPMEDGKLIFRATQSPDPLRLVYGERLLDVGYRLGNRYVVGDLCLDFDIEPLTTDGDLVMELSRNQFHFRLELPLAGGCPVLKENDQIVALELGENAFEHTAGEKHHIEFSNADGVVRLVIDGKEVFEHAYDLPLEECEPEQGRSGAAFGAEGADIAFWNLRLRKDVYYTNPNQLKNMKGEFGVDEPYLIPEGQYFFLGDNSRISSDSRAWGTVPQNYLLGEAFFIFRPIKRWRFVN